MLLLSATVKTKSSTFRHNCPKNGDSSVDFCDEVAFVLIVHVKLTLPLSW